MHQMTKPSSTAILFSMVAVIWLGTYGGTNYNFPAYISTLGTSFSLSQAQLNILAFSEDSGKLFAPVSGFALLYLPLQIVLIIGSLLGFSSFFIQFLYASKIILAKPPFWFIYICNAIAGNSVCWYNTVCYTIIFTRFRQSSRDIAVGFLTCFQGLSAEIYADMVAAFMSGLSPDLAYLSLNATIPFLIVILVILMVATVRDKDDTDLEGSVFWALFSLIMAVGLCAGLGTKPKLLHPIVSFILFRIFLFSAPFLLDPLELYIRSRHTRTHVETMEQSSQCSAEFHSIQIITDIAEETKEQIQQTIMKDDVAEIREEYYSQETTEVKNDGTLDKDDTEVQGAYIGSAPIEDMLPIPYLLLYFAVYLCGITGTTFLSYLGMISESRNYTKPDLLLLINLAALANFFGRLLPSVFFCFRFFNRGSRPLSMVVVLVLMAVAIFLGSIDNFHLLQVSIAVVSACTGAFTTISVSATRVLFGINNFAVNHNIVIMSIPCGSALFGFMVSRLFEQHSTKGMKCTGRDCFQTSFVILAGICVFGAALAYMFHLRSVRRN